MMKYKIILYVLFGLFSLSVSGQHNNEWVFRQFSSEEQIYMLQNDWYYKLFHKDYINNKAPVYNTKTLQNITFQSWLAHEKNYADSIDTAYTARWKVEQKRLIDRQVDLVYESVDRVNIESAMSKWNSDINKIITYGGTSNERKVWLTRYNCIKQAVTVVHEGNEPSGSKHTFYLDLLNEIDDWHTRLKLYLMSLVCSTDLRKSYEALHKGDLKVLKRSRILVNCQASRIMRLEDYARSKMQKKIN